jgi:hypothetical protein
MKYEVAVVLVTNIMLVTEHLFVIHISLYSFDGYFFDYALVTFTQQYNNMQHAELQSRYIMNVFSSGGTAVQTQANFCCYLLFLFITTTSSANIDCNRKEVLD